MRVCVRVHARAWQVAMLETPTLNPKPLTLNQVAMLETPDMEGGQGGAKSWDTLEESWMVEHAKEVQRMMPGGLMVMGIYFFCPSEQVSVGGAKSSMAYSILRKIARFQAAVQPPEEAGADDGGAERLFLHVCSKSKRNSCKAFQVKDSLIFF